MRLQDKEYRNPFVTNPMKVASETMVALFGVIERQDPQTSVALQRVGRAQWIVVSFHLNNVVAKKKVTW